MAWPEIKEYLAALFAKTPQHLVHGKLGERAAKRQLQKDGLKFLTANFDVPGQGEIDLIFREADCLVFVEVKTRSSEEWSRPAAAVDKDKRRRLVKVGLKYRLKLPNPRVKFRFDIVEVLLEEGAVHEIRHIKGAFNEDLRRR